MFHAEISPSQLSLLVRANVLSHNAANVVCVQVATEKEKEAINTFLEKAKQPALTWVTLRTFNE